LTEASPQEPESGAAIAPFLVAWPEAAARTGLLVIPRPGALPAVWAGPVAGLGGSSATEAHADADAAAAARGQANDTDDAGQAAAAGGQCGLLPQHATGWYGRPGLSGYRLGGLGGPGGLPVAGRDWSPLFRPARLRHEGTSARIEADDEVAGLRLATDIEAVPGGAIRCRHTLTNTGAQPYVVDGLEVVIPLPAGWARRWISPAASWPSASRSDSRLTMAFGCARDGGAGPVMTRRP